MRLRAAEINEFAEIRDFYWNLIDKMKDQKERIGWKKGIYPSDEYIGESIKAGELYVFEGETGILASVIINSAWNEGYEGVPWHMDCSHEDAYYIHALGVDPAYQSRGIGGIIIDYIIEMAVASEKRTLRLDIISGNSAAERLYTKKGFKPVQAKTLFYEDTGWTEYIIFDRIV